ncbi:MAG: NfeD family protein [Candidatus Hadarchaeales archaeon]
MRKICAAISIAILLLFPATLLGGGSSKAYVVEVGGVNAGTADFLVRVMERAGRENAILIIKLNGGEGLLNPTRRVVEKMLENVCLTVAWVAPSGARASFSGYFLLLASRMAVAGAGTAIGPAAPVLADPALSMNLTEWAENIAGVRGRTQRIAGEIVSAGKSLTAEEAMVDNLIDGLASTQEELRGMLDFYGAPEELKPGPIEVALDFLSNPQISLFFFLAGFLGLLAEISLPGLRLPGVAGIIFLAAAGAGLIWLNIDHAGLAVLCLGLLAVGYAVAASGPILLGVGGVGGVVAGMALLGKEPWVAFFDLVSGAVIVATVCTISLLIAHAKRTSTPRKRRKEILGKEVIAVTDLKPTGMVKLGDEFWRARCEKGAKRGDELIVKEIRRNVLIVEKK